MQLDIGFGDVIVPGPVEMGFPTLLDSSTPFVQAYSWDSVVAEKFEAIVKFNYLTSRMKDFFDILFLAQNHSFQFHVLKEAIHTTFKNRSTSLTDRVYIFSSNFKNLPEKQEQWQAFLKRSRLESFIQFKSATTHLERFLEPCCKDNPDDLLNSTWNSKKWSWR